MMEGQEMREELDDKRREEAGISSLKSDGLYLHKGSSLLR